MSHNKRVQHILTLPDLAGHQGGHDWLKQTKNVNDNSWWKTPGCPYLHACRHTRNEEFDFQKRHSQEVCRCRLVLLIPVTMKAHLHFFLHTQGGTAVLPRPPASTLAFPRASTCLCHCWQHWVSLCCLSCSADLPQKLPETWLFGGGNKIWFKLDFKPLDIFDCMHFN